MIKVIFLDLGKVIIDYDPSIPLAQLTHYSALPIPKIKEILSKSDILSNFDLGIFSKEDFYSINIYIKCLKNLVQKNLLKKELLS